MITINNVKKLEVLPVQFLYTEKFPAWKFQVAVQFTILETNIGSVWTWHIDHDFTEPSLRKRKNVAHMLPHICTV